jgi:hypothetical protein
MASRAPLLMRGVCVSCKGNAMYFDGTVDYYVRFLAPTVAAVQRKRGGCNANKEM